MVASDKPVKPISEVFGPYTIKPRKPLAFGVNGKFREIRANEEVTVSQGEFETILLSSEADAI